MSELKRVISITIAFILLFNITVTAVQAAWEQEDNGTWNVNATNLNDGEDMYGFITSESDVDWYKVIIQNTGPINFWMDVPDYMNYTLEIYDYKGGHISGSYKAAGENELISINGNLGERYYIKISQENGYSQSNSYQLRVKSYAADINDASDKWTEAATVYDDGTPIYGKIGWSGDIDWYRVVMSKSGTANFYLDVPASVNYDMEIYDYRGAYLGGSWNGLGAHELIKGYKVKEGEGYYIRIYGQNGDYSSSEYQYQIKSYIEGTNPYIDVTDENTNPDENDEYAGNKPNYYSNLAKANPLWSEEMEGKYGGVIHHSEKSMTLVPGLKYEYYLGASVIMNKLGKGIELTDKDRKIYEYAANYEYEYNIDSTHPDYVILVALADFKLNPTRYFEYVKYMGAGFMLHYGASTIASMTSILVEGVKAYGLRNAVTMFNGGVLAENLAYRSAQSSKQTITIYEKNAAHIFRDSEGHFIDDTIENRNTLIDMAANRNNYLGNDKYGSEWYSQTLGDGSQIWAQVRDGAVRNGGINMIPRTFNPETGLALP